MNPASTSIRPDKVKYMLMAASMGRAVKFYRDVIGFEEIFTSDYWSELSFGDAIIALHGGHDGATNPTGLSLQFEDIFEAINRIEAGGAKIIEPPVQREGEPILLGRFRDPEGNEVYITQYLG